jgi:hypothetical protein
MDKAIGLVGNIAGVVGVVICLISGLVRIGGAYAVMDVPAGLTFQAGVGLMVFACLAKLHSSNSQP